MNQDGSASLMDITIVPDKEGCDVTPLQLTFYSAAMLSVRLQIASNYAIEFESGFPDTFISKKKGNRKSGNHTNSHA